MIAASSAFAQPNNDAITADTQETLLYHNTITDNQPVLSTKTPMQTGTIYTANLLLSPNPAEAQVGLHFHLPHDATTTVEIVDVLQRPILFPLKQSPLRSGEHDISIPLGMLSNGSYTVRVKALLPTGQWLVEQRPLLIIR